MRGAQRRADRRGSATGRPPAKNQVMQIRVVTLRYNEALQGFPEDALRTATFGREVLNVSENNNSASDRRAGSIFKKGSYT